MWIKLTKSDRNPVLVNMTKMSGASATKKGGSSIEFDERYAAPGTRLIVEEPLELVAELSGAPTAQAQKQRRVGALR